MGWAIEIQVRAERRAGELLAQMPKHAGELRRGTQKGPREKTSTLAALGISKNESSTWQKLAKIPEPEFEKRLAVARPCSP